MSDTDATIMDALAAIVAAPIYVAKLSSLGTEKAMEAASSEAIDLISEVQGMRDMDSALDACANEATDPDEPLESS